MSNTYGYAELGRHGLGNMLIPWARCYLWCKDNNLPMIAPVWTKLRIGPYLRCERDKRNYQRLFNKGDYISGVKRVLYLLTCNKIPEEQKDEVLHNPDSFARSIVVFRGMKNCFKPLISRHYELLSELTAITKPAFIPKMSSEKKFIGIHVRRGDFSIPTSDNHLRCSKLNYQIPSGWYISALNAIREFVGHDIEALVFSDGSRNELYELLQLQNVRYIEGHSAITDILYLSQACVIIASGSTFSMWASYLNQVPCIWYPGQRRQFLIAPEGLSELEPEWEVGSNLPTRFVSEVKRRFESFKHRNTKMYSLV